MNVYYEHTREKKQKIEQNSSPHQKRNPSSYKKKKKKRALMSSLASSSQSPLLLCSGYSYSLGELARSPGFKHCVLVSFKLDIIGKVPPWNARLIYLIAYLPSLLEHLIDISDLTF